MSSRIVITNSEDLQLALDAGYRPDQIDIRAPDVSATIATARAAAKAEAETRLNAERAAWEEERRKLVHASIESVSPQAEASIRAAERGRIMQIMVLTRRGLHGVAMKAIDQGLSVEQFAMMQLEEMADRGITLDAISRDAPPPAAHAAAPKEDSKAPSPFTFDEVARTYRDRAGKQA